MIWRLLQRDSGRSATDSVRCPRHLLFNRSFVDLAQLTDTGLWRQKSFFDLQQVRRQWSREKLQLHSTPAG